MRPVRPGASITVFKLDTPHWLRHGNTKIQGAPRPSDVPIAYTARASDFADGDCCYRRAGGAPGVAGAAKYHDETAGVAVRPRLDHEHIHELVSCSVDEVAPTQDSSLPTGTER